MPASTDASLTPDQPDQPEPPDQPESVEPVEPIDAVIGVRFHEAGRIYHYRTSDTVYRDDYVVAETPLGIELGRVVAAPETDADPDGGDLAIYDVSDAPDSADPGAETDAEEIVETPRPARPPSQPPADMRPIERLADADDRRLALQRRQEGERILDYLRREAAQLDLALLPVAVRLNLDGDRGVCHFQSADRVDFRQLVNDVLDEFGVGLRMQSAGDRDRAKLIDGHDICGLRLCCASWMTDFPKVGIRTAKDQDLSLNPDSISGVCGRLLCCLTFEHDVYRDMRGHLPRVGKRVSTPAGMGKVIKLHVLQQKVTIALDDHSQRVDVPAAEIGLAVRTEDAPNQALIDARQEEQRRAAALRQAAAPAPEEMSAADTADTADTDSDAPPAPRQPRQPRQPRRRRSPRREQAEASEDAAATPSESTPAKRRRRPSPNRRRSRSDGGRDGNEHSESREQRSEQSKRGDSGSDSAAPRRRRRPRRPPPTSD